jgi:hypothetical protein
VVSDLSNTEFERLVRAVVEAATPRLSHVATAAAEAAQDRAREWQLIPGTMDPDSVQGPYVDVYPDDNPDQAVQVVRLDPRQGIPGGNDGERTRTLILHTPPAGGFAFGIIPDDPEANEVVVQPEAYRELVATTGRLDASATALTGTGDTDLALTDVATVPGRTYLHHLHSEFTLTNAIGLWTSNLEVDGTLVDRFDRYQNVAAPGVVFAWLTDSWIEWEAPDSGPHDFVVHAVEHSGTANLQRVASAAVLSYYTIWGTD